MISEDKVTTHSKHKLNLISNSPEQTLKLANRISKHIFPGTIVCLTGHLGSGKTLFTQGLVKGLGCSQRATSPTFKLINIYQGRLPVYHFDLYRIDKISDIEQLGYREYLFGSGVSVIEWAEKIEPLLSEYLKIEFFYSGLLSRKIKITVVGKRYMKILGKIA